MGATDTANPVVSFIYQTAQFIFGPFFRRVPDSTSEKDAKEIAASSIDPQTRKWNYQQEVNDPDALVPEKGYKYITDGSTGIVHVVPNELPGPDHYEPKPGCLRIACKDTDGVWHFTYPETKLGRMKREGVKSSTCE